MIEFTNSLRARIEANLAAHHRVDVPLDERRRAAVAIVIVDSDATREPDDPAPGDLSMVPGDISGLDGRMQGVAGGAAFLLCRRAAK
ncbi:MAG: CoA pyrophosphatase, partial [Ilumatobacteraceae bacterium]